MLRQGMHLRGGVLQLWRAYLGQRISKVNCYDAVVVQINFNLLSMRFNQKRLEQGFGGSYGVLYVTLNELYDY